MKLGLLVVLAVATLVPDLSESRTVTKCELKTKLEAAIKLPKKFKSLTQKYLALVICELECQNLNTDLVQVSGDRVTTTAEPTTTKTTKTTTAEETTSPKAQLTTAKRRTKPTTAEGTTSPKAQPTTAAHNRRRRAAEETPTEEPEDQEPPTEEPEYQEPPTEEPEYQEPPQETPTEEPENQEAPLKLNHENNSEFTPHDQDIADLLSVLEDFVDEEKLDQDNYSPGGEDGSPWSLGKHGLFQLTDGHHCNSTYRLSSDVCNKDCEDFTDDDISDDTRCFVTSYYHWWYAMKAGQHCIKVAKTPQEYFKDCE